MCSGKKSIEISNFSTCKNSHLKVYTVPFFLCVCVCRGGVCLSVKSNLTSGASVLQILSRIQWATEVKIFVGFSLKPLCSVVMAETQAKEPIANYYSGLPAIRYSCSMYSETPAVTA